MSIKEKRNVLEIIIWTNLIIGIYNLFIFINVDSYFHLILGILNVGVWVFNRDKLTAFGIHWISNKKIESRKK